MSSEDRSDVGADRGQRGEPIEKVERVKDNDRSRYRLSVYRFAQARVRDEAGIGVSPVIATWAAVQDTSRLFDLEPTEWALLLHCLLVRVARP